LVGKGISTAGLKEGASVVPSFSKYFSFPLLVPTIRSSLLSALKSIAAGLAFESTLIEAKPVF
jgi:hypothetical protein